jgi:hypothetical protein
MKVLVFTQFQNENKIAFYKLNSKPYGLTYGQWTVKWWQWALSFPKSLNPVIDPVGKFANMKQPNQVFFLAGKFGSLENVFPNRKCTVPLGKSILLPVINYEANSIEYPELRTRQDILDNVSRHMDGIVLKDCLVNGQKIIPQRIPSDPKLFPLNVNEDLDGLDKGRDSMASADGYWVFLKPLPRGEYEITFKGSCESGRLNSGAKYTITIE